MSDQQHQAINPCLRAVWLRAQGKHAVAGLLAFARWFAPLFLLIIVIDRFAYLPGWLRGVVAIALLLLALQRAWRHGARHLRSFNAIDTARRIEQAHGGMDSLLVTAVHFERCGASPGTSEEMWELTRQKAETAAKSIRPGDVVSMAELKQPLRIALAIVAVLLLAAVLHGSFLIAGLGRLFTPWQTIAYPTKTHIHLDDTQLVFKEGAPATLQIRISGVVPKTATIALQTGKGRPRELEMEVIDGVCTYEISSASRDFTFRVKAGDTRTEWCGVKVIQAPRMADVKVELDYPDYIDRPNEQVEAMTLTVPEQTKVRWQLTLDTPIRKATLHRDGAEDLPLQIGEGGRTVTLEEVATASRGYSLSWIEDIHGFDFESPRYFLQVASDQPPRVELTSPVANLSAMINRPLQFAVRAHDDHGIGTSTITYRVNLRPEKTINLDPPLRNAEGEQKLDWDYRKELTDLQVGDTVSFVLEVADKYPGEGGAHRARSESRRITFLSREDYLADVTKQMERLLNRVRTLYRQERAAHDLALGLDPQAESFVETCQLEAIRQEMLREQLVNTAVEVQTLLDDLEANGVSDAVESSALVASRDALRSIAGDHVARAADLLRAQVGVKGRNPLPALDAINQAARELSTLVLLRGIDASREVFARETQVIAGDLARLRLRLADAQPDQAAQLSQDHEQLAAWTGQLLDKLTAATRYDKRPLAVLGLERRIHDLRRIGVIDSIRKAATLAGEGRMADAAKAQYGAIRPLLGSQFTMRAGSEYALINQLREQLAKLITAQRQLHTASGAPDFQKQATTCVKQQAGLYKELVVAALPAIPAAHARLTDLQWPQPPPCDELRLRTESLMRTAIERLEAGDAAQAQASQAQAIETLVELDSIVTRWAGELIQKSVGASEEVTEATERVGMLEQLENRQVLLIEQTEEAALDNKNPKNLLDDQQAIAEELAGFLKELTVDQEPTDKQLMPLVARIGKANQFIQSAAAALQANKIEDALKPQEDAAAALAEARGLAQAQLSRLSLLQQLIGFEKAVEAASSGMTDILGAQGDLMAATKTADKQRLAAMLPSQRNLHQCLSDIAPALALVAERLDVGTPLVFAASDLEDAIASMEDGDGEDAADLQSIAFESLGKVKVLVDAISTQTGYVAEIVEFLQQTQSQASMLGFRQRQLREDGAAKDLLALQEALSSDASDFGHTLTEVAGQVDASKLTEDVKLLLGAADVTLDFNLPATHMTQAAKLLKAGQPASEAMLAAEQSFESITNQLNVIISMLNGLPGMALSKTSPPDLKRLIDILDVASKHRGELRHAHGADAARLKEIGQAQQKLVEAVAKTVENGLDHPLLELSRSQMGKAAKALAAAAKDEALKAQLEADRSLRHFIIEQALILNTAPVAASSSSGDVVTEAETDDLYTTESLGFVTDFVSGETPKDKKTEWEILGTRNRAALNQNFARELPLEYRATLKNYYERVAK